MSPDVELRFEVRSRPDPAFPKRTLWFVWDREKAQRNSRTWKVAWKAEDECRRRNARNRAHRGLPPLPELEQPPRRTPKQALLAHIHTEHHRVPAKSMTMAELGSWHAREHHRYSPNHYHAGPNTDAANRPPGWWTGADSVRRQP